MRRRDVLKVGLGGLLGVGLVKLIDWIPEEVLETDLTSFIEEGCFTWEEFIKTADLCDSVTRESNFPIDCEKVCPYVTMIDQWFRNDGIELHECQKEQIARSITLVNMEFEDKSYLALAGAYKAMTVTGRKIKYVCRAGGEEYSTTR
jgi:hypothetical protein